MFWDLKIPGRYRKAANRLQVLWRQGLLKRERLGERQPFAYYVERPADLHQVIEERGDLSKQKTPAPKTLEWKFPSRAD